MRQDLPQFDRGFRLGDRAELKNFAHHQKHHETAVCVDRRKPKNERRRSRRANRPGRGGRLWCQGRLGSSTVRRGVAIRIAPRGRGVFRDGLRGFGIVTNRIFAFINGVVHCGYPCEKKTRIRGDRSQSDRRRIIVAHDRFMKLADQPPAGLTFHDEFDETPTLYFMFLVIFITNKNYYNYYVDVFRVSGPGVRVVRSDLLLSSRGAVSRIRVSILLQRRSSSTKSNNRK